MQFLTYKHHKRSKLCPLPCMYSWHLHEMNWRTFSKILGVSQVVTLTTEIRATRSISDFNDLLRCYSWPHSFSWKSHKYSRQNPSGVLGFMRRDLHDQSDCFQISGKNDHVLSLLREMVPYYVEIALCIKHERRQR